MRAIINIQSARGDLTSAKSGLHSPFRLREARGINLYLGIALEWEPTSWASLRSRLSFQTLQNLLTCSLLGVTQFQHNLGGIRHPVDGKSGYQNPSLDPLGNGSQPLVLHFEADHVLLKGAPTSPVHVSSPRLHTHRSSGLSQRGPGSQSASTRLDLPWDHPRETALGTNLH